VENSSQDVSPFAVIEDRVEIARVISETVVGDETSGNWDLKRGEFSSGVVTEEDDGDGGGTTMGSGLTLSEGRRVTLGRFAYGCGENVVGLFQNGTIA